MTMVIFDPPVAVAVALCATARTITKHGVTERHPRPCGWCDYPLDELSRMLAGFNEWAGFDAKTGRYEQHDARSFQALPAREQRRQVEVAQDFPVEVAPPPPPAHEDLAWLG